LSLVQAFCLIKNIFFYAAPLIYPVEPVITMIQGQMAMLRILHSAKYSSHSYQIQWLYPCESCPQVNRSTFNKTRALRYTLMDNKTVLRIIDTKTHDSGQYRIQIIRGITVVDMTFIQLIVQGLSINCL